MPNPTTMATPASGSSSSTPETMVRKQLQDLIDNAPNPKAKTTKKPTKEEIGQQRDFKEQVRALLDQLPPGHGMSYKTVMRQVKEKYGNNEVTQKQQGGGEAKTKAINNKSQKHRSNESKMGEKFSNETLTPVDYLCILDFEATCDDCGPTPGPQEIIEFPTLLMNVATGEIEATFHQYIKPDVHPKLSDFCTDLTGITQDMVDAGMPLEKALDLHQAWLDYYGLVNFSQKNDDGNKHQKTFIYVLCGDWDLDKCLPNQLNYHGRETPSHFSSWINVKWAFQKLYHKKAFGMKGMLGDLKMELEGRHHSGIDDCRNIARICKRMVLDGWRPCTPTTDKCPAGSNQFWNTQSRMPWPPQPDQNTRYKCVYLIRHGQSLGQTTPSSNRQSDPLLQDCRLTTLGREEAKNIGARLGNALETIELIVSSPLERALNTAVLAFPNREILVDYDIREAGSKIPENLPKPMDEVLKEIQHGIPQGTKIDHSSLRPKNWPTVGGGGKGRNIYKSFQQLHDRKETTFAVVCHYNVIKTVASAPSKNIKPDNAVPIKCMLWSDGSLTVV